MLPKNYIPQQAEPGWLAYWQKNGIYNFLLEQRGPVYSIDTPPATVSGNLHLGHVYSYSHADFLARFWRMNGQRVFYPMGYDDNGLPTERLVEKRLGLTAQHVGRGEFIEKCLSVSAQAEIEYQHLWMRLGLSIDWHYTYRTIDTRSRRISQFSFIDLYHKGYAYRRQAPAIWCPECRTAIAQAELNDLERQSEFITIAFLRPDSGSVAIATTRPELLPACVAVFVHPQDERYQAFIGQELTVPLFGQKVPILADPGADPEKGSGAVMCCTFGDSADVNWWYSHRLPLVEAITSEGTMSQSAGIFAGLPAINARQQICQALTDAGLLTQRQFTTQSVRVHERCDTAVEYIIAWQWFINVLDHKAELIQAGEQIRWQPEHMGARYRSWVENLSWDWCISRQRYYGVAFPVWYCQACGKVNLAEPERLPVDPVVDQPTKACECGSSAFLPETDVMDTWATSSLSPQIVAGWLDPEQALYDQVFPFSLRPQAHEIIRTWAFYTIVKSHYHFGLLPWKEVLISGWGIAGEGMGKISKSRGGGPLPPIEMIERYSADAVRYWSASSGPGKDAVISEGKIQLGSKLVTKLWNVARFSERFLTGYDPQHENTLALPFTQADRWILASLNRLIEQASKLFQDGEYSAAKSEIENFFWRELTDNYLEMAKQRLYAPGNPQYPAARFTLWRVLLTLIKLFAPLLPYITEEIYQGLFTAVDGAASVHISTWPLVDPGLTNDQAIQIGEHLIEIAASVRRYKSEHSLSLGSELDTLLINPGNQEIAVQLEAAIPDLKSVCRVRNITFQPKGDQENTLLLETKDYSISLAPNLNG